MGLKFNPLTGKFDQVNRQLEQPGSAPVDQPNGIPVGGTTDQLLAKNSNTNFDAKWVDAPTGGGGSSEVNSGVVDGVTLETLPVFFNEDQQALKIFYLGNWITLAQVSFDSLWDSLTDEWDSATMTWDSPLA